MTWQNLLDLSSKNYACGYCNYLIASSKRYYEVFLQGNGHKLRGNSIYICPHCKKPTFFLRNNIQVPDVLPGNDVLHVPDDVNALYNEARKAVSINAYTGAVLLCRKLLMNIAVSLGADEGKQFIVYVDYLASQGYIPPNGRAWVDHIRKRAMRRRMKFIS